MASLRTRPLRDGAVNYAVLFREDGRQTSITFPDLPGARRFRDDVNRLGVEVARRLLADRRPSAVDGTPTVAAALLAYARARSGITVGTRRKYERTAHELARTHLGRLPIDGVTRADVTAWVRDLEEAGLSAKTIVDRKAFVSAMFAQAVDDQVLPANPAQRIKVARTERREMTLLTPSEFGAVLAHLPDAWRPLFITLYGTGLRIGEATALQVRDLHLDDHPPTLTVARGWVDTRGAGRQLGAPKTARGRRTIALPPDVADVLRPLTLDRRHDDFVLTSRGHPIRSQAASHQWHRALAASGLTKRPRVHDIRHSHASWMIAQGTNLTALQHRLGHASIKVTSDTYGHLLPEAQIQMARAAALAFAPAAPLELAAAPS